ncbi:MAG: acyl carrier protein [Planctomycetes bacterium]|nr:acyl carrier protein [Planctomycetota bacterium]
MDDIQATVKAYILGEFLPDADGDELTASTPLIAGGILDSLATVRLVTFLEAQYGIEVQAHEVNADNLDTLDLIAGLVRRKQAGGTGRG